jgi:hypothetical protein
MTLQHMERAVFPPDAEDQLRKTKRKLRQRLGAKLGRDATSPA